MLRNPRRRQPLRDTRCVKGLRERGDMVSIVRGQDTVHRQTSETRVVPYGSKHPDVESRGLRHRRSRQSQTATRIHTQNTYRFCIGSDLIIRVYVDAAYGILIHDGKSHSGTYTVLGVGGVLEAKLGKQKNVTKSSAEADFVTLSDHAGRGINLRKFLAGQGYGVVPVII